MERRGFQKGVLVVLIAAALGGCVEPVSDPTRRTLPKLPPPSTDVGKFQAWKDAERVAGRDDGRQIVIGSGESMRPIYGENTVLVLAKINYAELRPGMQIAYLSRTGRRVVHVLLSQEPGGWRVQGLNNQSEDGERVTRDNLIGVVYASFATDEAQK
jgi:hypothetical protein